MTKLTQHPVPENILKHIGDIIVSFALIEYSIQILIWSLINEHQRLGQIVTAELSFNTLISLVISLYKDRHGNDDDDFEILGDLMKRANDLQDKRNRICHSIWGAGRKDGSVIRFKTTAKQKAGIKLKYEEMGEATFAKMGTDMKVLAYDINHFRESLLDQNKAIKNPLKKYW